MTKSPPLRAQAAGPTGASGRTRRVEAMRLLLVIMAASIPFLPALQNGFVYDDGGLITNNPAIWSSSPTSAWHTPYWPGRVETGLYRPWTTFSYWIDARLFDHHPAGFHLVNLILHLGCSLLLWRLLVTLFPRRPIAAWITAVFFALHPLHTEAIVSVVGRSELLATGWGLLAYLLALVAMEQRSSRRLAVSLASTLVFLLALLSKESALGLLALPILHLSPWTWSAGSASHVVRRHWRMTIALWCIPVLLLAWLRTHVLGSLLGLGPVSISDNVLAHVPLGTRILTACGLQWIMVLRLLIPHGYVADYSYPQIVPGAAWMCGGAVLLGLALAALWRVLRHRDAEIVWGASLILASGALTANILFPVGTVLGERLAYLPSGGALWILASLAVRRWESSFGRARVVWPILAGFWALALAIGSYHRTEDWKSDLTLFRATAAASPRSAKAHVNLSVTLANTGDFARAVEESAIALRLLPGYPVALDAHGSALARSGRPAEAIPSLRQAARSLPGNGEIWLRLGNAYLDLGQGDQADSAFQAAGRIISLSDRRLLIGLASARALSMKWSDSSALWRRASSLAPDDPAIGRNWAFALWKSGAPDSAEAVYRMILAKGPNDPATRNDLSWFLVANGRNLREAVGLARAAFSAQPDTSTGDTLLEALLAENGCERARGWVDSLSRADRVQPLTLLKLERKLRDRCRK
jgi:protein O-mannosyl-transferase